MNPGILDATIFWGKAECDPKTGKPIQLLALAAHCLDVAWVFRKLAAMPVFRRRLEAASAASRALSDTQLDRLAVIALLHDVGKANLGFQDKIFDSATRRAGHIRELAPLFADEVLQGRIAGALQVDELFRWFEPEEGLQHFLLSSWSHHGIPQVFDPADQTGVGFHLARTKWWHTDGKRDPFNAVADLLSAARTASPEAFAPSGKPIPASPRLQHRFAGLLMLADWLGSHRAFFPLNRSTAEALKGSADRASVALRSVGLDAAL